MKSMRRFATQVVKRSAMVMPTHKHKPRTAEIASHQYLIQAGYIKQLSAGVYYLLPSALRVIDKIGAIIDSELSEASCEKLYLPTLQPLPLWQESGRDEAMGKEMFRVQDRHGSYHCLAPTAEEAVAEIFASTVRSSRDLPLRVYQTTLKYRDEPRPRHGLLRATEFSMCDVYTLDESPDKALETYHEMIRVMKRILERVGLTECVVAEADSGTIGGSLSAEVHLLTDAGEDIVRVCESEECRHVENAECVKEGDVASDCRKCGSPGTIAEKRGLELMHAFVLGDTYLKHAAAPLNTYQMACFGIGVTRLLQAFVEARLVPEFNSVQWPVAIRPYAAVVILHPVPRRTDTGHFDAFTVPSLIASIPLPASEITVLDDRTHVKWHLRVAEAIMIGYSHIVVATTDADENVVKLQYLSLRDAHLGKRVEEVDGLEQLKEFVEGEEAQLK